MDCHFHKAEFRLLESNLREKYSDVQRLDHYAEVVCGPFGTEITLKDYQETGIPLLRISNITTEGTIDETELVFLNTAKASKLSTTQVRPEDLVISQRGTLGMPAVIPISHPIWNISANLIAIRNVKELLPDFVQLFISTRAGAFQLMRTHSGQVQGKITTEDVASILIPHLPLPVQREMVEEMEKARESRRRKLEQADALIFDLDTFLLEHLGLTAPPHDDHLVYGTRLNDLTSQRLDAHFYRPYFRRLLDEIKRLPYATLGDIVGFSKMQCDPALLSEDNFRYIEISGVNRHTGEITATETPTNEAASRARMVVREGDIIVSLTRPHHGSIAFIDAEFDKCIASTGFAVIHEYMETAPLPIYLLAILRSSLSLQQMLQKSSGGNYPAITEEELKRIIIPKPDEKTQNEIVDELNRRHAEARQLRNEAEREWQAAKARFEARLLREEATQ